MLQIIKISNTFDGAEHFLDGLGKQVKFASIVALTRTAKRIADEDLKDAIAATFDRPTPYTLSALRVKPATKKSPVASVLFKDETYKGNPATTTMAPHVYGGLRTAKRGEKLMRNAGYISDSEYLAPGQKARLDQYGNQSKGQIQQILSGLGSQHDVAQRSKKGSRGASRTRKYFFSRGGHLARGVYERTSGGVAPVLMAIKTPHYSTTYDFYGIASDALDRYYDEEFSIALDNALSSEK